MRHPTARTGIQASFSFLSNPYVQAEGSLRLKRFERCVNICEASAITHKGLACSLCACCWPFLSTSSSQKDHFFQTSAAVFLVGKVEIQNDVWSWVKEKEEEAGGGGGGGGGCALFSFPFSLLSATTEMSKTSSSLLQGEKKAFTSSCICSITLSICYHHHHYHQ